MCRTTEGPLHGWVLALQVDELQLQVQLEKDKSQEWETLTEELVTQVEQVLKEVGTLKADRALQVGLPWRPACKGERPGHSPVLVTDQRFRGDQSPHSPAAQSSNPQRQQGVGTGITSQGHWPSHF